MKKVIVAIPCYNEEGALPFVIEALAKVRDGLKDRYRLDVLFVNDGSSDGTQAVLEASAKKYDFVYYRQFSRNAGHQSALRAGINASVGYDAVIMMDADMQHPPELIPEMLAAWEEGVSIVQMIREDSAHEAGFLKYITSKGYYQLINRLTGLHLEYGASDFRLIDGAVAQTVAASRENDLFLRGYFSWIPASRRTIPYKPHKRVAGVSKYSLRKMLDLAYKGVLQFSEKPLQIAMTIGLTLAALSFVYGAVLVIGHFTGAYAVSGWTSLMVGMLFCFGVNFILMGIIGNYLAHLIRIEKQRPEFIVASEKLPELKA